MNRPLHDSSEATRLALAKNLSKLPCLITRCNGCDCRTHAGSFPVLVVPVYISAVSRLLDGADSEVTPAVRREGLRALRHSVDHHCTRISLDGLDRAIDIFIQNLKNPDRGIRLSAG